MKRTNYIQLNSNYIQLHTITSNYIQLYSIQYFSSVSSCRFCPRTLRRPCPIEGVPAAPTILLVYSKGVPVSSNLPSAPFEIPGRKRYPRVARTAGASRSMSMTRHISTGRRHLANFLCDVSIPCVLDSNLPIITVQLFQMSNCSIVNHRFPGSGGTRTKSDLDGITACMKKRVVSYN